MIFSNYIGNHLKQTVHTVHSYIAIIVGAHFRLSVYPLIRLAYAGKRCCLPISACGDDITGGGYPLMALWDHPWATATLRLECTSLHLHYYTTSLQWSLMRHFYRYRICLQASIWSRAKTLLIESYIFTQFLSFEQLRSN